MNWRQWHPARWFMASLRRRLLFWLVPATLLAGIAASAATYLGALAVFDDLLGDQLEAIAHHVVVGPGGQLSLAAIGEKKERLSGQTLHGVLLEIWDGSTRVFSSDPNAHLPAPQAAGLSDVAVNGRIWRTFVSRSGDMSVRVAQTRQARWAALAGVSLHLLWPVLSLLPVIALFLWFGIGYALRPLRQIASGLQRRDAENLQVIDTAALPIEVRPLVDAINDLLTRLDRTFTAQKHFIADAAHELRTPIMGLGLQAALLPKAERAEEREEIISQIQAGTARLARLAEQLLTLARLEPNVGLDTLRDVDVAALARSVVRERLPLAETRGSALQFAGLQSALVHGSEGNLRILLNNLVDNALRYAGDHARIDLVVDRHGPDVTLEVRDNGPGIPEADRARIWERFYRGQGHGVPGSGLGLSIVKRIAEQHRAMISLESGPHGQGLTVRLVFKAHGEPAAQAPGKRADARSG